MAKPLTSTPERQIGAEHAGDLVGRTADDAGGDAAAQQTADNVTRLRQGIKPLEPKDGESVAPVH